MFFVNVNNYVIIYIVTYFKNFNERNFYIDGCLETGN